MSFAWIFALHENIDVVLPFRKLCLTTARYDGDDNNPNTAALTAAIPATQPPTQLAPPTYIPAPDPQPVEAISEQQNLAPSGANDQDMNEDDQDDGVENWVTEQSNDAVQPVAQQQEPFGSIREDG